MFKKEAGDYVMSVCGPVFSEVPQPKKAARRIEYDRYVKDQQHQQQMTLTSDNRRVYVQDEFGFESILEIRR